MYIILKYFLLPSASTGFVLYEISSVTVCYENDISNGYVSAFLNSLCH